MTQAVALLAALAATTLVALTRAEYEATISLGAIIVGLLAGVGALAAVVYGARYKVVAETASARAAQLSDWLEEAQAREQRLEQRLAEALTALDDARRTLQEQAVTIERLEALPNLERLVKVMHEERVRTDEASDRRLEVGVSRLEEALEASFTGHERAAEARVERIIAAVQRGPVPEGGPA